VKDIPKVQKADIAGSLRRKEETIGDIDILVMSSSPEKVIQKFVNLSQVVEIIAQGTTKASVRIQQEGRQADIRVIPKESYGSALQYFTGSKAHNVELRKIAQKKGLKLSEYGLFRGEKRIAGETEEGVYKALGEKMPPPESRKRE
jgi:DNA polymerase (family 10)